MEIDFELITVPINFAKGDSEFAAERMKEILSQFKISESQGTDLQSDYAEWL